MSLSYDDNDEESIFNYAKKLAGKTFKDLKEEHKNSGNNQFQVQESFSDFEVGKAKGELGTFLEKIYFGYMPNSNQAADFPKVGIELKLTCIEKKKKGGYSAGERLSITNISYKNPIEPDFYKSHVWEKIKLILLIHYLRDKSISKDDYPILFVNLFTPPAEDLQVIINDYNKINFKIKSGLAHELSESDTLYLGACTKGANALSSIQPQYYGDKSPAKKRNFCFKRSYMDYILQSYVLKHNVPYESVIKNTNELLETTFENYILDKINNNIGKSDEELCKEYKRPYNKNKAQWSDLAYRMLGIKGNHASEFVKANIVVKSIRLEENGSLRECMSLPPFNFETLVSEKWDDSELLQYFEETRFLFVIYKKSGATYKLLGTQIWNMPYSDLHTILQVGWKNIQRCIKSGVKFNTAGKYVRNNLPGKNDNPIIHIRTHSTKSAYKLNCGFTQGNIKRDANELPNGEWMTTQSFWLNNTYILSQLKFK